MRKNYIIFLSIICSFGYISCNSIHGEAEKRSNSFFLVNKSGNESYTFTIKKTEIQDDSIYRYSTQLISLAPGDEQYLGPISSNTEIEYPTIKKERILLWEPQPEKQLKRSTKKREKESKNLNPFVLKPSEIKISSFRLAQDEYDTVINGKRFKYRYETEKMSDKKHPIPRKYFKYKYEVTGETLLKK